jgi:hypothetical protein
VIAACQFWRSIGQPPNRRLQRTALCAREIVAILKAKSARLPSRPIGAPPLKRNTLGGIWTERELVHEMQLMVVLSNVIVCWRDLRHICRDQQCIQTASCAGVASGNRVTMSSAFESHRVLA